MAGAERKGGRRQKELQAQSKPASNNEQQIAMGTRSSLLLPRWTNSELAVGFKTWQDICDFTLACYHSPFCTFVSNFNKSLCYSMYGSVICLCNIEVIWSVSVFSSPETEDKLHHMNWMW